MFKTSKPLLSLAAYRPKYMKGKKNVFLWRIQMCTGKKYQRFWELVQRARGPMLPDGNYYKRPKTMVRDEKWIRRLRFQSVTPSLKPTSKLQWRYLELIWGFNEKKRPPIDKIVEMFDMVRKRHELNRVMKIVAIVKQRNEFFEPQHIVKLIQACRRTNRADVARFIVSRLYGLNLLNPHQFHWRTERAKLWREFHDFLTSKRIPQPVKKKKKKSKETE
eukprot:TRINITY_DN67718_c3_g1_i1.p1 TRINITY_DN67718_c3_g1~~TRINITY_DN67718_c3_g1_i1.p1  ORF type:complete len:219 (+),score=3.09 TRINITY_DN67718_c3_g1_i1:33-689(+)